MKSFDALLSTDRDWVRLTIGDSTANDMYFEDETLDAIIAGQPNKWLAAAEAGEALMIAWTTKGAGIVEKHVDSLSIVRAGRYGSDAKSDYRDHLARLREKGAELVRSKGRRFIEML